MKKFTIEEKIFKTETLFIIGSFKEANDYFKKRFNLDSNLDELDIGSVIKVRKNGEDDFFRVMWLENLTDIPLIVHEVFHLVVRICQDKGVSIKANIETGECGDETAAYLLEFYMQEILKKRLKR